MSEVAFVDTGDVTIQVDPVKQDMWIHDGYHEKWVNSQVNSAQYDLTAMRRALGWERSDASEVKMFMPTGAMLDSASKYPVPEGARSRGYNGQIRESQRYGQLPVIAQQIYDGTLTNKSAAEIEHEMREADRRLGERLYNRDGYSR